jgi:dihydrofolate reductase
MTASVFVGTSVDGFIARPNGALDFLPPNGGEPHGYVEFMATIDAVVIGRKTFETVLTFADWPYDKPVIVLSTHPKPLTVPAGVDCEIVNAEPAEVLARLMKRGFAHVYVDGGVTVQRFLAAGLINRLIITRVPVLIGDGIPLFGRLPSDIRLEHIETRSYRSGLVRSEYQVVPTK